MLFRTPDWQYRPRTNNRVHRQLGALYIVVGNLKFAHAQYTTDCGNSVTCYKVPRLFFLCGVVEESRTKMFEKTLSDLVRGIRAHRGTEVRIKNPLFQNRITSHASKQRRANVFVDSCYSNGTNCSFLVSCLFRGRKKTTQKQGKLY